MNVMAGIVLFNPAIARLNEDINTIYNQVDMILLIDNGSDNFNEVEELVKDYNRIVILDNEKNLGVATALKEIMDYAIMQKYDWVLTLDQDSVCQLELVATYSKYCKLDKVGILTCNIIDRNFTVDAGFKKGQECRKVSQCITSGSLISVRAYCQTDGFDEKMFIDLVDIDLCINMRIHGFKVVKINYDGILHEIGHGKSVKLLLRNYITYNHSSFRQYYMARNRRYLMMKYPSQFSRIKEIVQEVRIEVVILFYEKDKAKKLKSRWKGLQDARRLLP